MEGIAPIAEQVAVLGRHPDDEDIEPSIDDVGHHGVELGRAIAARGGEESDAAVAAQEPLSGRREIGF